MYRLLFWKRYYEVALFLCIWLIWTLTIALGNDFFYLTLLGVNEIQKCGYGFRYDYTSASSFWVSFAGVVLSVVFYFRRRKRWVKTIGFYERSKGRLGYFFGTSFAFTIFFAFSIASQWLGACHAGKLGVGSFDQLHSALVVLSFAFFLFTFVVVLLVISERLNEMESNDGK